MSSWKKNGDKLLEAARKCDGKTIAEIVSSGKVNVNVKDTAGCTAVHLCCKSANLESLAVLLEHGANTDVFDNSGMAPLHHAAVKDYVETMALLISYGADVDVQTEGTSMTPLHYASVKKRHRALTFLLFCGAAPDIKDKEGRFPEVGLSQSQSENQKIIHQAYKDRHIQISGKMIRRNEKHSLKHGLMVDNTDKDAKPFLFLCRKMLTNYMAIEGTRRHDMDKVLTNGSGDIISDLYDYMVNTTVTGVTVSVPVYTRVSTYDDVVLKDDTGDEFKCSECLENAKGVYYAFITTLKANQDNTNTFAVIAVPRKDITMTTGTAQTISSTVDPRFGVQLTDRCLPKNTKVELQIRELTDYSGGMNTDYVTGVSNMCTILINNKNRQTVTITLPQPDSPEYHGKDTNHTVFHAGEDAPTVWREVDSCRGEGEKVVDVTDPTMASGTCVVLEVHRKRKAGFLDHVVGFLKWLYTCATKRLNACSFYGMTRLCSSDCYKVMIGVADVNLVDDVILRWCNDNFVTTLSQKTSTHLLKSNSHLLVRPCDDIQVKGLTCQTLVYQCKRESHQEFLVCGKERDVAQFLINQVPKEACPTGVQSAQEGSTSKNIAQINIELLNDKNPVQEHDSSFQFTDYPDNKFINWLAGELGHEWMMVGIGLGQKYSFLERIEKGNSLKRMIPLMLYTWRNEADQCPDVGMTLLLHSLTRVGRKDLVSNINQQVQKLLKQKPDERVCRWVDDLTSGLDDVDAGSVNHTDHQEDVCISCLIDHQQVESPFDESFLLTVVSITGSNPYLLAQLNVPQSTVDGVRQAMSDPVSAMFKCLLIARRNYGDVVSFYEDLFAALETDRNMEAICRLTQEIRIWYKTGTNSLDSNAHRLDKVLDKYQLR